MIRYFCDLCEREITNEKVYKLEVDTDYTQGSRAEFADASLAGRLYPRRVCCGCALRAIEPVPKAASREEKGGGRG